MMHLKRILLLLVLILPFMGMGQNKKKLSKSEKKALELYDREFGNEGDAFKVSTIPDKYSGESSVILAKKVHVVFGKDNGKNGYQFATRMRIFLNDQSAVEDYSEFYYQKSDVLGISLFKPDGSIDEVNLENAVEVTTDVPRKQRDRFQQDDYYKVAIPNLQVGDVIDFYKVFSSEESGQAEYVIPVASSTPVLNQEMTIDVEKYWTLYYGTLNGAPEFVEDTQGGYSMKGKKSDNVKRVKFEYTNAEAKEWERWADVTDEGPMIKLMAAPYKAPLHQKRMLIEGIKAEGYITNSMVGVKDVTKIIYKGTMPHFHGMKLKKIEESDAAETIYRGLRVLLLNSMSGNTSNYSGDISRAISRGQYGISDAVFASLFAKLLKKSKIDSEIVLAKGRSANNDDFLIGQEVTLGVYIPKIDKYYWPFDNYIRPGNTPYYLQGLEVIHIPYEKVFDKDALIHKKVNTLPLSTKADNGYKLVAEAVVDSVNTLTYSAKTDLTGYFRFAYSPMFLYHTNYLYHEFQFAELEKVFGRSIGGFTIDTKNWDEKSRSKEEFDEYEKTKDESIKRWLEREHTTLEVDRFWVEDFGMMSEEEILKIEYDFTSKDFIKKAGPNLIFDIGKVIGDQLELDKDELEGRRSDVRIECPKSITTELSITIPEGLTANGVEDLNINVDNEVGTFISTAVQEGNIIKVTTTKNYNLENFSADKWPLMVAFQEAAYELSQKKVILK